jgi:hypothetical protein
VDVVSFQAGHDDHRIGEVEGAGDLVAHARVGGRRERHGHGSAEAAPSVTQHGILLAEAVAPRDDAVRLVDHEQRYASITQPRGDLRRRQRLGGHEQILDSPGADLVQDVLSIGRTRGAVNAAGGVELAAFEVVLLIARQREERGHHHRRAVEQCTGRLVDRGLPGAGRQHGQHVTTFGECRDRAALDGGEPFEPEAGGQLVEVVLHGVVGLRGGHRGRRDRHEPELLSLLPTS